MSMNGRVFESHQLMSLVNLSQTNCIDAVFQDNQLIGMSKTITERCGFNEAVDLNFDKVFANCSNVPAAGGYIIGGEQIRPGEWPFLAALLFKQTRTFFCGGNLITKKHVLTAAHCVHQKHEDKLKEAEIVVLLGRHSLKSHSERTSVTRSVDSILIHPNWDSEATKYNDDIAMLVLLAEVPFTPFIQPVCVTGDDEIMKVEDGYVVRFT